MSDYIVYIDLSGQRYWFVTWLVPRKTAAVSVHVLNTPYNRATVYSVTSFEAAYVGCSCHLPAALLAE